MASEKPFLWYYGSGSQPEIYHGGYSTREQAVSEGRAEYGADEFSIVEAQKGSFSLTDASDFLEWQMDRWADDDMGAEDSPEWSGSTEALTLATAELDQLLSAWSEKHAGLFPAPWCL